MTPYVKYLMFALLIVSCKGGSIKPNFLEPCSLENDKCIVELWKKSVQALIAGQDGVDIPPLDPLKVENVEVEIPGVVRLNFTGVLKGIKNCEFEDAKKTIKKGIYKETVDLNCNVVLKGNYDVTANSSVLFNLDSKGQNFLKSDSVGKIKIENLKIKMLMDFDIVKDAEDGEVKFMMKKGPVGYKYQIGGPVTFQGTKILLAGEDISGFVVSFLNNNWKFVMDNFGGPFVDKAFSILGEYAREFIDNVPANYFFKESLEEYV